MKISDNSPIRNTQSTRKKREAGNTSGVDFSDLLGTDDAAATEQAKAPQAVSSINSILSLQEVSDEEVHKREVVQWGAKALDSLEQLRHSLLLGRVPEHVLRNINQMLAQQRQQSADPRLLEIINDIELRAAVELAKLEAAHARREQV